MANPVFSIIAIEDDESIISTIREFAEATDVAFEAFSGPHTLDIERLHHADIILLDLQLEEHDGLDVISMLAKHNVQTPIILCSGMEQNILNATRDLLLDKNLICNGELKKPFTYYDFVHAISKLDAAVGEKSTNTIPAVSAALSDQDIYDALKNNWFTVYYQPQIQPQSGELTGIECLARLAHPVKGLYGPFDFLPRVIELDVMEAFTEQVIQIGLAELGTLHLNDDVIFSFNLDANSIKADFLAWLLNYLSEHAIPPSKLCLEVTELSALDINSEVKSTLTKLRIRGISLSLDDFGTGYSTIQELNELPFNELKIDRSFVASMATREASVAIIRSTIDLADRLNFRVVAEGAETIEQVNQLLDLGCTCIQGFYYSKPMPIDELRMYCNKSKNT
ncbi:EAL domain-containing protein [Alteromonas sediminis]|uniref:EAL domain-containing protein n=1 Tax=Alteromonas sediminis TaxID=2259342 RepID=A0A3N5YA51_9ALTE|nr:EAL domain-containing response regulator [Alteromonas sediminis]RPJ68329.1 EAL domain-containing protein [Alteromonas sediminis]